jgi:dihydrofolate reductase
LKVKFIAIAALGKNREIGLQGKLPWNIPSESEHYKNVVKGKYVLIGRKNFELHNEDIEGTMPIVLTKNTDFSSENAVVCNSMDEVVQYADDMEIETIYVIGGGEIYNLTLPFLSEFLCSVVDYEGPADTYFPQYMSYEWEVINTEIHDEWTLYHMIKRPDF